jgi:hypothetical protein
MNGVERSFSDLGFDADGKLFVVSWTHAGVDTPLLLRFDLPAP